MRRSTLTSQRLAALFFVGLMLLFSPMILLFDGQMAVLGIPLLYLYLFGVWAVLIGLSARLLAIDVE